MCYVVLCILVLLFILVLNLQKKVGKLEKLLLELKGETADKEEKKKEVTKNFRYLAIGNSITRHGKCSYWWDDRRGMAASDLDRDYVHQFAESLKKIHGNVDISVFNFCVWETQAHDRAEVLPMLDQYLAAQPDLITVQLSENVQDQTTFKGDFRELLRYIHEKVPQARIMVIGEVWAREKDEAKRAVASEFGYSYVSVLNLLADKKYSAGMGTIVKDDQGIDHAIDHEGVAGHPGDLGMKYYAEQLLSAYTGK